MRGRRGSHFGVGLDTQHSNTAVRKQTAGDACPATNVNEKGSGIEAAVANDAVDGRGRIAWPVLGVRLGQTGESAGEVLGFRTHRV